MKLGIAIIIAIIIIIWMSKITKRGKYGQNEEQQQIAEYYDEEIEQGLEETYNKIRYIRYIKSAYIPKWMFTYNEKRAYYRLEEIASKYNLYVFAKVRLFDLVTPSRNHPKYKTNLYKIQAKHVDFVLTKENLVAKYIIELDDSSHNTRERQERDEFVDTVLRVCGYKVLHTKEIQEDEITTFINS